MADNINAEKTERGPWQYIIRGMWRTPLGIFGAVLTTVSITLMVVGLAFDLFGVVENPYANLVTYLVLPGGMITGLAIIPLAAWLRRRQWHRYGISREHLRIDLSDRRHRKGLLIFIILSVINISILGLIGYEGYHFTESPTFCGKVCHKVMEPEYTVYQRSPHSNVACVECHIGPGVEWFVRSKISGLRQVVAITTGSYSRPIPAPVEALRPAHDTCENCHAPKRWFGTVTKDIKHLSNDDQKNPEETRLSLHVGGLNPATGSFEGIHWHVANGVEIRYLAVDEKRNEIARVRVTRPDNTRSEYVDRSIEVPAGKADNWRLMDCIDCHNRPTHIYDMPEDVVDFGLMNGKINSDIPGIRADALAILSKKYASQEEARKNLTADFIALVTKRDAGLAGKYRADLEKAGAYLTAKYLGNIWPRMNIFWGTYPNRLGHRSEDYGGYKYASSEVGCFRCHDDEHEDNSGNTIPQNCDLCHDEPE